jgi:hypothetical protein
MLVGKCSWHMTNGTGRRSLLAERRRFLDTSVWGFPRPDQAAGAHAGTEPAVYPRRPIDGPSSNSDRQNSF